MLSTNLLDMKKDPYSEDRQLAAPKVIVDLVERFESNQQSYKSKHHKETQTVREFCGSFFQVWDWTSITRQGFYEAHKDVVREEAAKVGAYIEATDSSSYSEMNRRVNEEERS